MYHRTSFCTTQQLRQIPILLHSCTSHQFIKNFIHHQYLRRANYIFTAASYHSCSTFFPGNKEVKCNIHKRPNCIYGLWTQVYVCVCVAYWNIWTERVRKKCGESGHTCLISKKRNKIIYHSFFLLLFPRSHIWWWWWRRRICVLNKVLWYYISFMGNCIIV